MIIVDLRYPALSLIASRTSCAPHKDIKGHLKNWGRIFGQQRTMGKRGAGGRKSTSAAVGNEADAMPDAGGAGASQPQSQPQPQPLAGAGSSNDKHTAADYYFDSYAHFGTLCHLHLCV